MNYKNPIRSGGSKYAGIAVRAFVAWLIIIIGGTLITAYLIHTRIIPLDASGYGVAITLLVSSFAASVQAISGIGEKRLLVASACTLVITIVLALCNVIFIGDGINGFIATMLVILSGCFAAALLKAKPKKRRRYIFGKY